MKWWLGVCPTVGTVWPVHAGAQQRRSWRISHKGEISRKDRKSGWNAAAKYHVCRDGRGQDGISFCQWSCAPADTARLFLGALAGRVLLWPFSPAGPALKAQSGNQCIGCLGMGQALLSSSGRETHLLWCVHLKKVQTPWGAVLCGREQRIKWGTLLCGWGDREQSMGVLKAEITVCHLAASAATSTG